MKKILLLAAMMACTALSILAQERIVLDSKLFHDGGSDWQMARISDVSAPGEQISKEGFDSSSWMDAIVPGTVLGTLVHNEVYPDPYWGVNNKLEEGLIPDLATAGRDCYTSWYRTTFEVPEAFSGKHVWMQLDGINYRAEVWVNGSLLDVINGMFIKDFIDVTDYVKVGASNVLAVKVFPVDVPGAKMLRKEWGATGEFHNGGDGFIGKNTTMLMSVGWDFTFMDGIRDRNTGIWKSVSLYATGDVDLRHPFIKSELRHPDYAQSRETVSVTVVNPSMSMAGVDVTVKGEIVGEGITFEKTAHLLRGAQAEVTFTPDEYKQLIIDDPKLWWPINKGPQNLYELKLTAVVGGKVCDEVSTTFGIREIVSDMNTPDGSRLFYVNGKKLFVRGTNWIPEAMLKMTDERTEAELRYTRQCGVNLIRLWGGGIEESETFYRLCDEMGFLVWQEFWLTGDTMHPQDQPMYLANVASTVKNIRNHPSLAYYVASNESSEVTGTPELLEKLDGTRGYQTQSECDGIHDGSPYKQVNPMRHYENTASDRGSRVDGFNPEYGTPCLPLAEELREMLPEKDLWPMNKEAWDYRDGNGFLLMTTLYDKMVKEYGESSSLEEYVRKAQFVGALSYKAVWEVWNYNKLGYGDRWASGVLFWHHNNAVPTVGSMMWDWSLEPLASLYAAANALEPLHAQFDYLKNTVSVVNDYYQAFTGYKVKAQVYDIRSKVVFEKSAVVDLPEDGVACDVIRIDFPENISQVNFIKLYLYDEKGKLVSENFYWRSNDAYEGKTTVTGPTTSGFQTLSDLGRADVKTTYSVREENGKFFVDVTLKNRSSRIAFFNQIELLDKDGKHVKPSFYTDNFFCLTPHAQKTVTIETSSRYTGNGVDLRVSGFNCPTFKTSLKH